MKKYLILISLLFLTSCTTNSDLDNALKAEELSIPDNKLDQNMAKTPPTPLVQEEASHSAKLSLEEAYQIASQSACIKDGQLTDLANYNEYTQTWWIDLDATKKGCNPACVVDETSQTAETNWRCTGLITD
jgi:predicted Zn-dependent protease